MKTKRQMRAGFLLAVACCAHLVANAQIAVEWTTPGAGAWVTATNWADGNVPNSTIEQARHTLGTTGGQITLSAGYVTSIHSFVGTPGLFPRNLRLQNGSSLTLGSVSNPLPGNGAYGVLLNPGSHMRVTGNTSQGLSWAQEKTARLSVEGSALGGTWRIGTSGQDNSGTNCFVQGPIRDSDWRVLLGASVGTLSQPVHSVTNTTFRFGEDLNSNGGGSLLVAGNFAGGALLMTPDLGDYPQPPTRIRIDGEISGAHIDLVSNSLGRPCDTQPDQRPRVTFGSMRDPVGEARFLKVDLEALPGSVLSNGDFFFDDCETFGTVSSIVGSNVTYHKANHYNAPGDPVGPAAHVGTIASNGSGTRTNLHLEGGWVGLGPGTSEIDQLRIDETGPNSCGYGIAALDVNDDLGYKLTVRDLFFGAGAGAINPTNGLGVESTEINIEHSLVSDHMNNEVNFASMRVGKLRLLPNSFLSAPDFVATGPFLFPPSELSILVQDRLEVMSRVDVPEWDCSGVTLQTERNPGTIGFNLKTVEIEVHSTDWGPHWFCTSDGSGDLDPRVKPWREFVVNQGTLARLVDNYSVSSGSPNDEHGAANTIHPNEAMFVSGQVKVESGAILDLNGRNLYTLVPPGINGTVINGTITVVHPWTYGTFDNDADVDDDDLAIIMAAYSGPGVPTSNILCDFDGDLDVDDLDLAKFGGFYAPGVTASCGEAKTIAMEHEKPEVASRVQGILSPSMGTISISGLSTGSHELSILDFAGRVIYRHAVTLTESGPLELVNFGGSLGVYYLHDKHSKGYEVTRISLRAEQ